MRVVADLGRYWRYAQADDDELLVGRARRPPRHIDPDDVARQRADEPPQPDDLDPAGWTVLSDGRLLPPSMAGERRIPLGPDTAMGRRILARLAAAGLPTEPAAASTDASTADIVTPGPVLSPIFQPPA